MKDFLDMLKFWGAVICVGLMMGLAAASGVLIIALLERAVGIK